MADENPLDVPALMARMSTVIGHEVRNPLAVISNSTHFIKAKLAAAGGEMDPKIAKHLGYIVSEIGRANAMIDDIVLLGRLPSEAPAKASRDLNAFLEESLKDYTLPAGVTLARDFSKDKIDVSIYAELMHRAILKVLANAVEDSQGGGSVRVKTERAGNWARLTISDDGPGFSEEALAHLFEPYFTTRPRGLGLGLRLARDIVAAHGGRMTAENKKPKGAAVTIELPVVS